MLKLNSELRAEARASLKGKWGIAAVITLIFMGIIVLVTPSWTYTLKVPQNFGVTTGEITGEINPSLAFLFLLLGGTVLGYGMIIIFLRSVREKRLELGDLFSGFRNYGAVLATLLLQLTYTILWSLLLIVPGIVKSYSYAMTPYLLHDHPELGAEALICKSMEMMKGHKMKLFLLDLSFIGWGLLCILTLCIGFLWLTPYMYSARAAFYEDVRTAAAA
jgi:uncharacterized membrane protein